MLWAENAAMKSEFASLFPDDIPHLDDLPTNIYHHFTLKDPEIVIQWRQYNCPKKYHEAWKVLLQQHLDAGHMRASDSPYTSPAFLIPKADPDALPQWVNDYCVLNSNTVPDMHPLPRVADILADCSQGKIWGKIDMMNSFFQTCVHPDDVKYTAITMPFRLYEWLVMPQGCRNAPLTHQRWMFTALRPLIGKICHIYLDDIIIWSQTLDEHRCNMSLFLTELDFLGHYISTNGIEADPKKVEKIVNWPIPHNTGHIRAFLGLVCYIAPFLPKLANFTNVLNPLTTKDAKLHFPQWTTEHQRAFDSIKELICSREVLAVINHDDLGCNKIFVSCDASDFRTGAMLSFGESLETACPVAFESCTLKGAELNYPVHEKELFAIVRALKKWRVDLLGVPFTVYTDHRMLKNFFHQKELSRCQARWQEFLAQYDFKIKYIKGEKNIAADVLSCLPADLDIIDPLCHAATAILQTATHALCHIHEPPTPLVIAASSHLSISSNLEWLHLIKDGYQEDKWCICLHSNLGVVGTREQNGLLFIGDRLVIPHVPKLREAIFRLVHNSLGHFRFDKSYAAICNGYYWPNMCKELEELYVLACEDC
ncbi:hypothetical protein SCP_1402470 [Sparassis crispa]|uniref:Reverse transcriptase domain-containing protein n=1 Tax=Sparassis crispa TaxID=139825 RepID=A0A401H372_9APHY|nr:hypothetical protein SCP_1402470 [Sparassis crispa]GBE88839.1 hypothetical protein SCP_1402470 [Sparassis crispa]